LERTTANWTNNNEPASQHCRGLAAHVFRRVDSKNNGLALFRRHSVSVAVQSPLPDALAFHARPAKASGNGIERIN
jgi:hypothetical protein